MRSREGLTDLEELILRCRDETAKTHVFEAVACYKAGAYRQCIVATWIAVVYDIIHKLVELNLMGDNQARSVLEGLQNMQQSGDLKQFLDFERGIIDVARDFEFVTPLESLDLARLRDDRNRCAHPSMTSLEDVYDPAAELARSHLRNAVFCLLQYPASQGKAALKRLEEDVSSVYFPETTDEAENYLRSGPLARPRESLVANFATMLVKRFIYEDSDVHAKKRIAAALNAVRKMHRSGVERVFSSRLSDIMQRVSDADLSRNIRFLYLIPDSWQYLRDDASSRLMNYVTGLPSNEIVPTLAMAMEIPELQSSASERTAILDDFRHLLELLSFRYRSEYMERAVQLFDMTESRIEADNISVQVLIPYAQYLERHQIERIVSVSRRYYGEDEALPIPSKALLIKAIAQVGIIPADEFDRLLRFSDDREDIPF